MEGDKNTVSGMRFLWHVEALRTITRLQGSVTCEPPGWCWQCRSLIIQTECREWMACLDSLGWWGVQHNDFQHAGKPAPLSSVKAEQFFNTSCPVWLQQRRNYVSGMSFVPWLITMASISREEAFPTTPTRWRQFVGSVSLLLEFLSHCFFQLF